MLLDECVDRRLAGNIQGHDVKTVPDAGWAALKNGELLGRAQQEFDTFVTDLRGLIPQLLAALPVAKRGEVTWVGAEQRA